MNLKTKQGDSQRTPPGTLAAALTLLGLMLVIAVITTAIATWQTVVGGYFATSLGGWIVVGMFALMSALISGWMYQLRSDYKHKKPRRQLS